MTEFVSFKLEHPGQPTMAGFVAPTSGAASVSGVFEMTIGDFDGNGVDDKCWFGYS